MTDALHSARPPGAAAAGAYEDNEAEALDAGDCEGVGAGEDGSETAGPAERPGGRRRGLPWTEAEHRDFLLGLQKLGKGDWRGISRHYVVTRTPTQVASHAQKHFIRQQTLSKRKRRHSLFDITGEEDAQPDAHGASHPQGVPDGGQPLTQQAPQLPGQAQPFLPQAMQQMPQFAGGAMGGGMPGFGFGGPMQAAAAAQGWNPAAGFMGQQFPNYFQLAQQQAVAGAMFLAQQQQQQQQVAMAAFMQQHGFGAAAGFGPQGFGGQGFGFGAPGMVHMLPHYQQAMFSQPSVNASMLSGSTAHVPTAAATADAAAATGQGGHTEAPAAAADDAGRQLSQRLPSQQDLQQQPQAQPLRGSVAFASCQLASGMGSNAGSWLGTGSVHGSNQGSIHGSRRDSMPEDNVHGSGSGGNGSGDGSGDGSRTEAATAGGVRQQKQEGAAAQMPEQGAPEVPPEGDGVQAKAHTPFADAQQQHESARQQAAGNFGHGRLYRPTASHAKPSHSLSTLPLFAPDDAEANAHAAAAGTSDANCGPAPMSPPAAAAGAKAAPHNTPHSAFMRPLPVPRAAADAKAWQDAQNCGSGGSSSGNSTANGGRSHGSSTGSGNASNQNKDSQRSSGTGVGAANDSTAPGQHSAAENAASMPGGVGEASKHAQAAARPPKRVRLGSPPPASAFEATPELAAAAQQRRG